MVVGPLGPNVSNGRNATAKASMVVLVVFAGLLWYEGLHGEATRLWGHVSCDFWYNMAFRDVPRTLLLGRQRELKNRFGVDEGLYRRFPTVSDDSETAAADALLVVSLHPSKIRPETASAATRCARVERRKEWAKLSLGRLDAPLRLSPQPLCGPRTATYVQPRASLRGVRPSAGRNTRVLQLDDVAPLLLTGSRWSQVRVDNSARPVMSVRSAEAIVQTTPGSARRRSRKPFSIA